MSYNDRLNDLIIYHLEANSLQESDYIGKYALANNGDEKDSYIERWDLELPRPTKEQLLALDTSEVSQKKNRREKLQRLRDTKLVSLTASQVNLLLPKLPDGALFIESNSGNLCYIHNGAVHRIPS